MKKLLFLLTLLITLNVHATHSKGGQIHYRNLGNNLVEFTFVGYRDINGVPFGQGVFDFGDGNIYGDDSTEAIPWDSVEDLGNGVERWTFKLFHTYSGSSRYNVSYKEDFRQANIINIDESISTSFYVESNLLIDPFVNNNNSSPTLAKASSFKALVGEKFIATFAHNDTDGDRLRYKLVTPLKGKDEMVNGYLLPDNDKFRKGNEVDFKLNPVTGDLTWDKPEVAGTYAIAIKVEEWRKLEGKNILIGYSIIDFIIDVVERTNSFVSLDLPDKSCIDPSVSFSENITITNVSQSALKMEFVTDATNLQINGTPVQEWNDSYGSTAINDETIELNLAIDAASLQEYEGLNNVIFVVSHNASEQDQEFFEYSSNLLIGNECDEVSIVSGISDPNLSFVVLNDRVQINFENPGNYQAYLFAIDGRLLARSNSYKNTNIELPYPFESNTVYVVSVHSQTGVTTKKIMFSDN